MKCSQCSRQQFIRNFSIIAHIDHGKSTLADRILEMTHTVEHREMKEQILDSMELERERGITIKLNAVELRYHAADGYDYLFHLIDTPGHVDFTYEVSRSLAACEGALLVIDATQGIEAQTLANLYLAMDNDLTIIPVINKIDLPGADPERIKEQIERIIGIDGDEAISVSAKTGFGVDLILEAIVKRIPAPRGSTDAPLRALIFDCYYDQYRGVIPLVRVVGGSIVPGMKIFTMGTKQTFEVTETGVYSPKEIKKERLEAGDVGYLAASIKDISLVDVGDTIANPLEKPEHPLPGYKHFNPMVYCGMYPIDNAKYGELKEALVKLKLNDASLVFEPENSQALGFGFRVGFLGLLHMDIIQERIEREFNIDLIATAPSVKYRIVMNDDSVVFIDNPSLLPDLSSIKAIEEPFVTVTLMTPGEYVGPIMELCKNKRGIYRDLTYQDRNRVSIDYEIPLSEIIFDFFDKLKSGTKGYASYDYRFSAYKPGKLIKLDILVNGAKVDALSVICHKDDAYRRGSIVTRKLKELLPRQMFEIAIQAAIGGRVIARTNIKALRKDVLAKCYGGDVSRKKKLLEKQKAGKKRMKAVGAVEIPQSAFLAVLSLDDNR